MATSLYYGDEFYVLRGLKVRDVRLWKAILATLPFHGAYLMALFWLDRTLPQMMLKAVVFMPLIAVCFAVESELMGNFVKPYFKAA